MPRHPHDVRVSADNGASWGPETYLCQCSGVKWQYDPVLKVASNGSVYATFMNGYDMMFSKSADHGATWTTPIEVSAKPWGDKPWIGVSPNGTDVYIAYETGATSGSPRRTTAGTSFAAAVKLNTDSGRYRYPNGLEVLPNGTALLSASNYPGSQQQTRGRSTSRSGARRTAARRGRGRSWRAVHGRDLRDVVDDGARERRGRHPRRPVHRRDGARGATATCGCGARPMAAPPGRRPIELANGAANASFPAVAGGAGGVFRLHYADNRTGAWNTCYRSSTDGGQTWSAEADISDADTGATYKTAAGFASDYGDYGAIDVTNTGKTVAVWGEGASFSGGPGGIWFNRQL